MKLKTVAECDCHQCRTMLTEIKRDKADDRFGMAVDAGGHGYRICRKYKGVPMGVSCGCYRFRKRIYSAGGTRIKEKSDENV